MEKQCGAEGIFNFSANKCFKIVIGEMHGNEFTVSFNPPFNEAARELKVDSSVIIEWAQQEAVKHVACYKRIPAEKLYACNHFGIGKVYIRTKEDQFEDTV